MNMLDDACLECDSLNIRIYKSPTYVSYECADCGAVWSDEDDAE